MAREPPEHSARLFSGQGPITDNGDTVHDDVAYADRILVGIGVRGPVGDRLSVEHGDVGRGARFSRPSTCCRVQLWLAKNPTFGAT